MPIKRLIFDVDNTLIPWKNEYVKGFLDAAKEYNLDVDSKIENEVVDSYEQKYSYYNKEQLLKHFNQTSGKQATMEFIDIWLKNLGQMSEENQEVTETLEYLSKKYELIVLSNWFQECQEERLAHARMRHFFIEVIGGDEYFKPNPKCFEKAIGPHLPEECIMIGDNINEDIKGALNCGLKAIYLTKSEEKYDFPTIKNLKELKNIL